MATPIKPLLIVFCCLVQIKLFCQSSKFITHVYTSQDGLPDPDTYSVMEDHSGYIWAGGINGLSRFNGNRFTKYEMGNEVHSPFVYSINENEKGELWVFSGNGAYLLKGTKFYRCKIDTISPFAIITEPQKTSVSELGTFTKNGFKRFDGSSTKKPIPIPGLDIKACRMALVTDKGWYYNFAGNIVFASNDDSIKSIRELLPPFHYIVIMTYRNNQLYFYTDNGIYKYNNGKIKSLFTQELTGQSIYTAYLDARNKIWVATEPAGILISESDQEDTFSYHVKLSHNQVHSFNADKEGNIWIAYFEGVAKVHEIAYDYFSSHDKYFLNDLNAVVEGPNDELFFFSETNGQITYKNNTFTYSDSNPLKGYLVDFWCMDGRRRIWCRTRQQKLFLINGREISIMAEGIVSDPYLVGRGMVYDEFRNKIWYTDRFLNVGDENGFFIFKDKNNRRIETADHIEYLGNGNILVQTLSDSIFLIDHQDRIIPISFSDSIVPSRIHKLLADTNGNIWISYPGVGLLQTRLIDQRLQVIAKYTTGDGLKNDVIKSLAFDKQGRLWVSTMAGISIIDLKASHETGFPMVCQIDKEEGMPSRGLSYGRLVCDHNGDMWYSTQYAIMKFRTAEMKFLTSAPHVSIENIKLNLQEVDWSNFADSLSGIFQIPVNPVLKHSNNTITIDYSAGSAGRNLGYQYSYIVKGLNQTWSRNSNDNSITLANLGPGTYTFLVKARKTNSDWSEPASFTFTIRPAFWQHGWFNPVLVLLFCGLMYWLYRFRVKQIGREQQVRRRLASDLHDDIGSTLSSISYYSEAIRKQVKESSPQVLPLLEKMEAASDDTVDAMSDIVWTTNPSYDKGIDLLGRMRTYATEVCDLRHVRLEFEADPSFEKARLNMETRRNLFLIFKEAVNNALKYSGCTALNVRIDPGSIRIQDNGTGFDMLKEFSGNGLKNMHQRAKEIKGRLDIQSSGDSGTRVTLTF